MKEMELNKLNIFAVPISNACFTNLFVLFAFHFPNCKSFLPILSMLHAFHSIDDSNFRSFACAVRVVCRNRTCCTPPKKTCEQMWTKNPEHRKWNLCVISHTFKRIKLKFKFKLPQQINQMSIWNYISQECFLDGVCWHFVCLVSQIDDDVWRYGVRCSWLFVASSHS